MCLLLNKLSKWHYYLAVSKVITYSQKAACALRTEPVQHGSSDRQCVHIYITFLSALMPELRVFWISVATREVLCFFTPCGISLKIIPLNLRPLFFKDDRTKGFLPFPSKWGLNYINRKIPVWKGFLFYSKHHGKKNPNHVRDGVLLLKVNAIFSLGSFLWIQILWTFQTKFTSAGSYHTQ